MYTDYCVGDRVICVKEYGPGAVPGDMGTVVKVYDSPSAAPLIHWDAYREVRHEGDGSIPSGHGWFVYPQHIEPVAPDLGDFTPNLVPGSIMELLGG